MIAENAITLPLSILKDVIKPTPAGTNKNDIKDIKISHMSSIISIFIILKYRAKKSNINPITVPGIGNLKTSCIIAPKKYAPKIIISCFKYFKKIPPFVDLIIGILV